MVLKGKIAVVVGATGGMGTEVCKRLYKEGVKIVILARKEKRLKSLSLELGNCDYYVCDLDKPETISSFCSQISQKYPVIDFLFNIAGIGVYKPIEEVTEVDWISSFNVNVSASYYFTKYLLPSLRKSPKAYVFNWGSGMGVIPSAGRSPYCMSKFALRGMSLSLAKEFERTNIGVVHLTLGSILTEFGPMTLGEKEKENLEGKAYLTPEYVVEKVIERIKKGVIDPEITIYPTGYQEEMVK